MTASRSEKREAIRKKIEALKAQEQALINKENAEARKLDTRRKIVFGGALMAHCAIDAKFAVAVRSALQSALTKEADRELLKDWLTTSKAENTASPVSEPVKAEA